MENQSLGYKYVHMLVKVMQSPHGRYTDPRKVKRVANIAQRLERQRRKANEGSEIPSLDTGRIVAGFVRQYLLN